MNRSLGNVILGGYEIAAPTAAATGPVEKLVHQEANAETVAEMLVNAKSVIITPGYGLAVARAQYPVADIAARLRAHGVKLVARHQCFHLSARVLGLADQGGALRVQRVAQVLQVLFLLCVQVEPPGHLVDHLVAFLRVFLNAHARAELVVAVAAGGQAA